MQLNQPLELDACSVVQICCMISGIAIALQIYGNKF